MKKILLSLLLAGVVQNSFAIKVDPASSRVTEPALLELNKQLLEAAKCGNTEVVKYLIVRGADVNASDSNGETPLMLAARWDNTEIAQLLIGAGANVNASNVYGETALMIAKERGLTEIVQLLREHGAVE